MSKGGDYTYTYTFGDLTITACFKLTKGSWAKTSINFLKVNGEKATNLTFKNRNKDGIEEEITFSWKGTTYYLTWISVLGKWMFSTERSMAPGNSNGDSNAGNKTVCPVPGTGSSGQFGKLFEGEGRRPTTDDPIKWRRYEITAVKYDGVVHDHPRIQITFNTKGHLIDKTSSDKSKKVIAINTATLAKIDLYGVNHWAWPGGNGSIQGFYVWPVDKEDQWAGKKDEVMKFFAPGTTVEVGEVE
mmetsp:Transcript_29910/g.33380  ORF Transcript_29910/g.33380 Transcript_29910/m.33380 type:complete len:244 (+) Transcript_29910:63-794(+)